MNFEKLNEKVFDDSDEKAYTSDIYCNVKGLSIQFKLKDLIEYSLLLKNIKPDEWSFIQKELGFDVIDFDGEKIFQGRKKGLRLYGLLKYSEFKEIFIFSCGEFQSGRFQIFLEGSLRY